MSICDGQGNAHMKPVIVTTAHSTASNHYGQIITMTSTTHPTASNQAHELITITTEHSKVSNTI